MIPRIDGWTIFVEETLDCSWLQITSDSGAGTSVRVERGDAAAVLQDFAIALANAAADESDAQRARDACIGAHGYDLDRLK